MKRHEFWTYVWLLTPPENHLSVLEALQCVLSLIIDEELREKREK